MLLLQVMICALTLPVAAAVDVPAVFAEFDRAIARELWPGFDASKIPVAVYDGRLTWLRNHPLSPGEFVAAEAAPGLRVYNGLHKSVRANTSVTLNGVLTATVMLDTRRDTSPRDAAALIAHECFHAYQRQHHPNWQGNEAVLFTYPVEDLRAAELTILEGDALRRAFAGNDRCWAARFAALRKQRFTAIGPEAAQYERLTELNEGLAQFIQNQVAGTEADLSREFSPSDVRSRAYAVGPAIAKLLDSVAPGWKARVSTSLDELIPTASDLECAFTDAERSTAADKAKRQVEQIIARRIELERSFASSDAWRVVVEAVADAPLMPAGFDPSNVERLGEGRVLHGRWLKLSNARGSAEAMHHRSITTAAGKHPLFNGVRSWTVLLDTEPEVHQDDGSARVTADGFDLQFAKAKIEVRSRAITVRIE